MNLRLPSVGDTVDQWTLDEILGQGGESIVFAARGRDGLGVWRYRALRFPLPGEAGQTVVERSSFLRTHEVTAQLLDEYRSDLASRLLDVTDGRLWRSPDGDDIPYVVMEIADMTLFDLLDPERERAGAQLPGEVRRWLVPVGRALMALHQHGYVHCDVKPENAFGFVDHAADHGMRWKIGDLGIAVNVGKPPLGYSEGWAPPDQVSGHCTAQFHWDVYAVANMVLFALSDPGSRRPGAWRERAADASLQDGLYDRDLRRILTRARAGSPADRYPTMAAFIRDLDQALEKSSPQVWRKPVALGQDVREIGSAAGEGASKAVAVLFRRPVRITILAASAVLAVIWLIGGAWRGVLPAPEPVDVTAPTLIATGESGVGADRWLGLWASESIARLSAAARPAAGGALVPLRTRPNPPGVAIGSLQAGDWSVQIVATDRNGNRAETTVEVP